MSVELRFSLPYGSLEVGRSYRAAGETWLYLGHSGDTLHVYAAGAIRSLPPPVAEVEPMADELDLAAFGAALAHSIGGEDPSLRQLALEVVSRAPSPPPGVALAIGRRVAAARAAPLAYDSLVTVMALYNVADDAGFARDDVAAIAGSLKRNRTPAGKVMREVAVRVLDKMDREIEAWKERTGERRRELEELARAGELANAEARLAEWFPDGAPDGGVTGRAWLCEEVGDRLREIDPAAARWLYRIALDNLRAWASWSSSGGEGLSRMVDVDRLVKKQL